MCFRCLVVLRERRYFRKIKMCRVVLWGMLLACLATCACILVEGHMTSTSNSCTSTSNTEYLGNNTVVKPAFSCSSFGDCCDACSGLHECAFFTFDSSKKTCTLRSTNAPDTSRINANCTSGAPSAGPGPAPKPPSVVHVTVANAYVVSTTGDSYVAWNIDSSRNRGFFTRSLNVSEPLGARLAKQAAALSAELPAGRSILRFGGSGNDYLTYAFNGTQCPSQGETKECMNETTWTNLLDFARAANAKIAFGLSMNTGHDMDVGDGPFPQPWSPDNARQILQWTIDNKYDDVVVGFELGNEQNSKYSGKDIAVNFGILHKLLDEMWPGTPMLCGPDPHSYHSAHDVNSWIGDFLDAAKSMGVPMHAATHHEYAEVDLTSFTSPATLDNTASIAAAVNATVSEHYPGIQIWAGEIGPHNGGSPPCDHTSMRWANFGDSFWYADALGAKARHGYSAVCRQDYIGADYGMVDCSTGVPLPDFFTGLLFARVMGTGVLDATVTTPGASAVRAYAHCGRGMRQDGTGAAASHTLGLLLINLNADVATSVSINLNSGGLASGQPRDEYLLQASTDPTPLSNQTGLAGSGLQINGHEIVTASDGTIPKIAPVVVSDGASPIELPALSIKFVTVQVSESACP